jgi:hypothetical protein
MQFLFLSSVEFVLEPQDQWVSILGVIGYRTVVRFVCLQGVYGEYWPSQHSVKRLKREFKCNRRDLQNDQKMVIHYHSRSLEIENDLIF